MELRQLEYFAAVARHGHFGRAASEVYVTQSALSQQIARLEAELGVKLLARTAKGVEMTPAGVELNEHATTILNQVARARAAIDGHRGAVRGVARIAATSHDSAGLIPALVAFHRSHPQIQLSLRHAPPVQLLELLATGAVDAVVLGVGGGEPRMTAGAIVRTLTEEPLRLVCAPEDPLAGAKSASIETLRGVPVILPERGTALRELVVTSCQAAGFSPLPLFETSDRLTIRTLASEGLGYSAIPESWAQGDGPGTGIATVADPVPRYRVALVHGGEMPPIGALLVEELAAFFAATAHRPL
ncbi:MAG TPA: LysR family transcriptional regulator [Solirubrobacteraceae bacterium]|nr:LysR family transcriptional regulator [Solirubrobacteraceae bacterium]